MEVSKILRDQEIGVKRAKDLEHSKSCFKDLQEYKICITSLVVGTPP